MKKINNEQLKKIVRDFLMVKDCSHPLIIWGKHFIGKTEIIDSVINEMTFCKLIKDEEMHSAHDQNCDKYPDVAYEDTYPFKQYKNHKGYSLHTVFLMRSLGINIGTFTTDNDELVAYSERFTCYRSINLANDSQNPRVIIEAVYNDEQSEQCIMQTVNDKSGALAYLYELTFDDWFEWATKTRRINPYYLRFVKENQNIFFLPINGSGIVPTPYNWDSMSSEFYRKEAFHVFENHNEFFRHLYRNLASQAYQAAPAFADWLEKTYGVKVIV